MTAWTEQRDHWVQSVADVLLLAVIAEVTKGKRYDENLGDYTERMDTIRWLATRGRKGKEWGIAADPARKVGGWQSTSEDEL